MFFLDLFQHFIEVVLVLLHVLLDLLREAPHLETDQSPIKPHRFCSVMTIDQFAIKSDSGPTAPKRSLYPDDRLERECSECLIDHLFLVISPSADGAALGLVVPFV